MRLPRFTTRRLMALVAVAALALWIYAGIERRSTHFRRLAQYHWERFGANSLVHATANGTIVTPSPYPEKRRRANYHRRLTAEYKRAARSPWLSVPPDPPPPE